MDTTAQAASTASWSGASSTAMLPVQVVRRELAARDVITLWLAAPGTTDAPAAYNPGQFITLALPGDGDPLYRSYSLCGGGRLDQPWEITVKRQHAGLVSTYLYDRAKPGEIFFASGPRGSFVLPRPIVPRMPLVFVAAGSGIAPIYGMLRALASLPPRARPRVQLHYASNRPDEIIYRRELAELDPDREWLIQWHYLASNGARLTPDAVVARAGTLANAAHWYICGPDALKRAMQGALGRNGVSAAQIHVETFGGQGSRSGVYSMPTLMPTLMPTSQTRAVPIAAVARVSLAGTGAVLEARPNETLLETLERHGYHPPYSCRAGECGDCRLKVLAGRVGGPPGEGLTLQERAAGYVLSCVARPQGDVTLAGAGPAAALVGTTPGPTPGAGARATRSGAKIVARAGLTAASVALFASVLRLTNSSPVDTSNDNGSYTVPIPTQQSSQPGASSTKGTTGNGGNGITTNPGISFPTTTTGVS